MILDFDILTPAEADKVFEYQSNEAIEKIMFLTKPNYFQFCFKKTKHIQDEVFEELMWELGSYPIGYRYQFYNFIGVYYALNGYFDKAEEYLIEASRMKPQSTVTMYNLIILYCRTRSREKAATYLQRVSSLDQWSKEADLDLAIVFKLFGCNVAAKQLLESYINSIENPSIENPSDFVLFHYGQLLLYHSKGKMYYTRQLDEAIRHFATVNKRNPSFTYNTLFLVKALNLKWRQSNPDNRTASHPYAISLTESLKSRKISKFDSSHYLYTIGMIHKKLKQYEQGKACLERSKQIYPNYCNHYQLGNCNLKLNELTAAENCFKAARTYRRSQNSDLVLKEATSLIQIGRKSEGLKIVNEALEKKDVSSHDKALLELFITEQNIIAVPDVSQTLDNVMKLLHTNFSFKVYRKLVSVAKAFVENLSNYYTTVGLAQQQVELFMKWVKFLQSKHEYSEEEVTKLTKPKQPALGGRRMSIARTINRRNSVLFSSINQLKGINQLSDENVIGQLATTPRNRRVTSINPPKPADILPLPTPSSPRRQITVQGPLPGGRRSSTIASPISQLNNSPPQIKLPPSSLQVQKIIPRPPRERRNNFSVPAITESIEEEEEDESDE